MLLNLSLHTRAEQPYQARVSIAAPLPLPDFLARSQISAQNSGEKAFHMKKFRNTKCEQPALQKSTIFFCQHVNVLQ